MSDRTPSPAHVATAAITLGGFLLIAAPGWAPSIVRLVLVTIAAAAGLHALRVHAPPTLRSSAFHWSMRAGTEEGSLDARHLRAALAGRRHRIAGAPPLPPAAVRLLQPLIEAAVDRERTDPEDGEGRRRALARLSPLIRAILAHDSTVSPPWFRTLRADETAVARVVDQVLDELALDSFDTHSSDPA